MKTLLLAFLLSFVVVSDLLATPQANDTIVIGGNTYGIFQRPMTAYWHHADEQAEGRQPFPKFEVTSTANWRGYIAKWSLSRGKLFLRNLEGQVDGKQVQNRQIIKERFPVHATWYTGKVFVAVGDFNEEDQAFDYVLQFTIKNGTVSSTAWHESLPIPATWNGLPRVSPDKSNSPEPLDAPGTSPD